MSRKNIFELLYTRWDIYEELTRLKKLFNKVHIISDSIGVEYTLKEFVNMHCFNYWKNHSRYIGVDDYLETLDFEGLYRRALTDINSFLTLVEIIFNFYYMAFMRIIKDENLSFFTEFNILRNNLDICLDHYNHTAVFLRTRSK